MRPEDAGNYISSEWMERRLDKIADNQSNTAVTNINTSLYFTRVEV